MTGTTHFRPAAPASSPDRHGTIQVLKILQCSNLGGMEQVAYGLLDDLARSGDCRFRVVSPRPFGPGKPRLVAVDPDARDFIYRGKFGWRSYARFKHCVTELAANADAAWVTGTCASSLAAIRRLRLRKILSHHFHHFDGPTSRLQWYGFYQLLCRDLDAITYPTEFTRNEAVSIAPWLRGKTHVVRYGYTTHYDGETRRLQLQREAREKLGLPPDAFVVGNAGWLIPRKRFDLFLHTAHRLAQKIPNTFFVICGGGPLESELKSLAARLGLAERIRFTGWVTDLVPHYQAWDVCLFTSDFDALGRTPMEAACHGCLNVASVRYGGLREFLRHGENGILFDDHHAEALAAEIDRLARAPRLATAFREAAIDSLRSDYSMEKSLDFYRSLLG